MLHQYDELSVLLVCLCDHETKSSPFSPVALIFLFDPSHAILRRIDQPFQSDKHLQAGIIKQSEVKSVFKLASMLKASD